MLQNKKILIAGLANKHSIAAGIAQAMHAQGAELAFTYQSERLKGNVEKIAAELGSDLLFECDVSSDESIATCHSEESATCHARGASHFSNSISKINRDPPCRCTISKYRGKLK